MVITLPIASGKVKSLGVNLTDMTHLGIVRSFWDSYSSDEVRVIVAIRIRLTYNADPTSRKHRQSSSDPQVTTRMNVASWIAAASPDIREVDQFHVVALDQQFRHHGLVNGPVGVDRQSPCSTPKSLERLRITAQSWPAGSSTHQTPMRQNANARIRTRPRTMVSPFSQ